MTVVDTIDPETASLADVARLVMQTHDCLDGLRSEHAEFREEQTRVNVDASRRRHDMADAVEALKGGLGKVERVIGGLKADLEITDARVTRLSKAFGQEKLEPGEKPERIKTIAGWKGWQAATALFGSLGGIVLAYKICASFAPAALRALHHAIMAAG